ncbi:MAG TPA: hypothetical protein VJQ47_12205 [Steroidobacteraceae bacterium]|nr:hypothetical protein [Steroidobacteraceae bacterium]
MSGHVADLSVLFGELLRTRGADRLINVRPIELHGFYARPYAIASGADSAIR